jgi:hypothetical protein
MAEPFKFSLHTCVEKTEGYKFPGVVVACFRNLANENRYVVEADHWRFRGMLHIFNESQLKIRGKIDEDLQR